MLKVIRVSDLASSIVFMQASVLQISILICAFVEISIGYVLHYNPQDAASLLRFDSFEGIDSSQLLHCC
jgi:hypothetical protein